MIAQRHAKPPEAIVTRAPSPATGGRTRGNVQDLARDVRLHRPEPCGRGIVQIPEASPHTSVTTRVAHVKEQGQTKDLNAAQQGSAAGSRASAALEETIWLCPIDDRRTPPD
jgi:hypothetical protein